MNEQWSELLVNLPAYLGGHILLSMAALGAALAISLPLGVAASRRPKLAESLLAIAGVVQTVPTLALLGLMMLLLHGETGFQPAFLTLVIYSVLPILANTVIGIRGVDPTLREAALGLGMNQWQMLWRVELPLAAPVILGGVRTATVIIVGTATLATSIGADSLGNYVYSGLATLNHFAVMFGCVGSALLAVGLDQLVHLLEVAVRRRSKSPAYFAAAGLLLVTAFGLYAPVKSWFAGGDNRVVIASAKFTEQYILSRVLAQNLEEAGFHPDRKEGMEYGLQLMALRNNDVDCLVTYTGDIWNLLMKSPPVEEPEPTLTKVTQFLKEDYGGVVCLGRLGFRNEYALAMTKKRARDWNVNSITDLIQYAQKKDLRLKIGGDVGVFDRSEWRSIKAAYQISDKNVEPFPMDQTLNYTAVSNGQRDAILAYTSDARVSELELLTDDLHVFPPYEAILLVSPAAVKRAKLMDALRPLIGKITQQPMMEANGRVDRGKNGQKHTPKNAAALLLKAIHKGDHP